ncbi:MAG TPA: LysR family transcriptional regulator, partial [Orrella sp.]
MTDKRIEVLRAVGQFGSISQAARATGVSYKAAWQAIETLGNLAGVPLIDKAVGGSGGGGARLTSHGLALLQAADRLNEVRAVTLAQIQAETSQFDGTREHKLHLSGMGLRASMR